MYSLRTIPSQVAQGIDAADQLVELEDGFAHTMMTGQGT